MAINIYPYFDSGTFENYPNPYANPPAPSAGSEAVGRTTEEAYAGTHSLLIKYGSAGGHYNQDYKLYFSFRGPFYTQVLDIGKRYKASCKIKVLNGAGLLGSDGVKIFLGKDYDASEGGVVTTVLADATIYTMNNGDVLRVTTVGQIKGLGWAEVSCEFTEPASGTPAFRKPYGITISTASVNTAPVLAVPFGEDVFNDGKLYIDELRLEEVLTCDLAFGTPAYTKTDETAAGANNGTITVNTTSSFAIQYKIDGGALQNSNVFTGVAPGVHSVDIVDLNGCTLFISNISILEFVDPPPPPPPPDVPAGSIQVNMKPTNSHNLVSWFPTVGKINFATVLCANQNWDLPKPFRLTRFKKRHAPVVVNDEQFSFYINFDSAYSYANFTSLRLDLVTNYGLVQANVGTLERVFQNGALNYYIYASVTLSAVEPGFYRLAITDTSTAAPYDVLFMTQEIEVMFAEDAPAYTARFRFRCSMDIYKILYSQIEDFLQEIRLRVAVLEEDLDGSIDQYRAASSGMLRNVAFDLDKFVKLETYYFDDLAHRGMFVFQAHDYILVNDKAYLVKGMYKVQWNPSLNINKGVIEMFEQEFSTINRYGKPNSIVIEDPVLGGDDGSVIGT